MMLFEPKEFKFIFRCRRCGNRVVEGNTIFGSKLQQIETVNDILEGGVFDSIRSVSWHHCEDENIGVTDFIGLEEKEKTR